MPDELQADPMSTEARAAAVLMESYLEHNVQRPLHLEARSEIESLARAHEELGSSPLEAMHAAIRQFGQYDQIGKRSPRQHEKRRTARKLLAFLRPRLVTAVATGFVGALLSRLVDLSLVRSGLVTYDGGFFTVALGFLMGCLTGIAVGGGRNSLASAALRGAGVFAGVIGALMLIIAILAGGYPSPFSFLAIVLFRFALAGAIAGFVGAAMGRIRFRRSKATEIARAV